jgi:hypothetical protein
MKPSLQLLLLQEPPRKRDEAKALAHRTDPPTSHAAAKALVESGKLTEQLAWVLDRVKAHPGCTCWEMSGGNVAHYHLIQKRMKLLEQKGKVERGRHAFNAMTGKWRQTWSPVEEVKK